MLKLKSKAAITVGAILLFTLVTGNGRSDAALPVQVKAADFASSRYLTAQEQEDIRQKGILKGCGEAEYEFSIRSSGWYELVVSAAQWGTDLFLDGEFLIYTPFESGVWETREKGCFKVMNLYLTAGKHRLRFSRPWFPGLPYMSKFSLQPAQDVTGMVRLATQQDYLIFRMGEKFPATLTCGKRENSYKLTLTSTNVESKNVLWKQDLTIPAGEGNETQTLSLPTTAEGVFDLTVTDEQGKPCDRTLQYLVIDTLGKSRTEAPQKKELVAVLDCSAQEPDYSSGLTRVVKTPWGAYRESGSKGREGGVAEASWFAYRLNLPSIQEPYLLEIEYPDDDKRTCEITLSERYGNPEPSLGYASGGAYSLSRKMQTLQFYCFPRQKDPRLVFYNWHTGERAAAGKIRIYRLTGSFPALTAEGPQRLFGMYQEEPLRYVANFGAMPDGDNLLNLWKPAERAGTLCEYSGIDLWNPTIAVYQAMLWPGKTIPGFQLGILPPGPTSPKSPLKPDVMRLMLLTCEKHGMKFVGEIHMPPNWILMRYLDERFGGKGTLEDDGYQKPWLTVSDKGEVGLKTSYKPYYNALYPGLQDWVAEVFGEVAERYKDSPAFEGIAVRLMSWTFGGWQTLASIHWGYEDYTVKLFEKETGTKIPVSNNDPQRFQKRYEWLMANAYDKWVDWRCRKIYEYHRKLAQVLTRARPDLKLYLATYGPNYGGDAQPTDYETKGWTGLIRESGIDPKLYQSDHSIVITCGRRYPSGVIENDAMTQARSREENCNIQQISATAKSEKGGSTDALHLDAESYEGPLVDVTKLGYTVDEMVRKQQSKSIYPAGVLEPAGRHCLERFANAMADGNMVFLSEGSHGYSLGQPQYLREFLAEYRALPAIGMQLLSGTGDPVALWWGAAEGRVCFYLANRIEDPVEVTVHFPASVDLVHLSTGEKLKSKGKDFHVRLQAYQFLAYEVLESTKPVSMEVTPPSEALKTLNQQLEFIETLVKGDNGITDNPILQISPVQFKQAMKRVADAKQAVQEGKVWTSRRDLLHPDMIRLYQAFHAYPPQLLYRKAPPSPEGALQAEQLNSYVEDTFRNAIRLTAAEKILPELAGEKVFTWQGRETKLEIPLRYSSEYEIDYAYLKTNAYAEPIVSFAGQAVSGSVPPSSFGNVEERSLLQPLSLRQGKCEIKLAQGKGSCALLYLSVKPVYHDLKAESFRVLGPFAGVENLRSLKDVVDKMDEALPSEEKIDLSASYQENGKTLRWEVPRLGINITDPNAGNFVDFYKTFGVLSHAISYAVTKIQSPDDRDAELRFGADYWAKIWLNGAVILRADQRPPTPPRKGEQSIPVKLRKGNNTLLIKVHAGSAGNGFWCALTDPGDLRFGLG